MKLPVKTFLSYMNIKLPGTEIHSDNILSADYPNVLC